MTNVEEIERAIEALPADDLRRLRAWWAEFEWAAWDGEIEADAATGRLDWLAEEARREHREGRTLPL